MATKSKIVESSFRLGAGRYIQEDGAAGFLARELKLLHCKRPFILHGTTAWQMAGEKIERSLREAGMTAERYEYTEFCNGEHCGRIVESEAFASCDCVVGVGGGNVCDASKLCAVLGDRPVITVPTSSATCAAYTPLSVCYNDAGQTVGSRHHGREVNCILADMEILCRQPLRLLVAGVFDSLAKLVETKQRLDGKTEDQVDIGLRSSFVLSSFIYDRLLADLPAACEDVKNGRNTKAVYDTVYVAIALTGVISGLARGSNQCAIGHKVYEATRTLFPKEAHDYLHGELVAIGLIVQHLYNGDTADAESFRAQMKSLGMPVCLSEVGIEVTEENIQSYFANIEASSALAGVTAEEIERFRTAFRSVCH